MGGLRPPGPAGFPRRGDPCSAASAWRIASAHLAPTLVSPQERRAIEQGLATLDPFSALIVERPLAARAPQVDVSLCATPPDGGPRRWPGHPAWTALRDFYRAWDDAEGVLRRAVAGIWLEFDRPQLSSTLPVPCFFANMRQAAGDDRRAVLDAILAIFPAAAARDELDRVLGLLPPDGKLDFLGLMLSRDPACVRLCLALPGAALLDFLSATGHAIDARLHAIARLAGRHAPAVVLHLDAGPGAGAIGVELQPLRDEGWPALLADLEHAGLCSGGERRDLLAVPHRSGISRHAGRLAPRTSFSVRAPTLWGDVETFVFASQLNHIKLVCRPGQDLAAKAYLRLGYKWQHRDRTCQ